MIAYKVAEKSEDIPESYIPLFYRENTTYKIDEASLTFSRPGIHSYTTIDAAREFLSTFARIQVIDLITVGCSEANISEYIKTLVILECEVPDEAILSIEGVILECKLIVPKRLI